MDGWDDTDDVEILHAAATVHSARLRVRRALGRAPTARHRIPIPTGDDASSALDELLGLGAAHEAQAAWDRLAAALDDLGHASPPTVEGAS